MPTRYRKPLTPAELRKKQFESDKIKYAHQLPNPPPVHCGEVMELVGITCHHDGRYCYYECMKCRPKWSRKQYYILMEELDLFTPAEFGGDGYGYSSRLRRDSTL